MKHNSSFNHDNFEIITMDVVQLLPNIDTHFVARYIIKKFMKIQSFIFQNIKIITEMIFECLSRYFRQKSSANIGGKTSPI